MKKSIFILNMKICLFTKQVVSKKILIEKLILFQAMPVLTCQVQTPVLPQSCVFLA